MNYKKFLLFFLAVSMLSFGLVGCDSGDDDDDDDSSSVATSAVSIAGTLSTSGLSNISTSDGNNDDGDFIVWVQNHATGESFEDTVDDDTGDFSISAEVTDDLTSGRKFIGVIINRTEATFVGTVSFDGTAASNRATGMSISGDVSDLSIDFDSANRTNGRADVGSLTGVSNIAPDTSLKMNLRDSNSKPSGFGTSGKGADSRGNSNSANLKDIDEDGIPDPFDAMNDGATLDNARQSGPKTEDFFLRSPIAHVIMFMNLKVDKGSDTNPDIVTDNATIVIEAQESSVGNVSAAGATILHSSWKTGVTLDRYPGGITPAITVTSTAGHTEDASWGVIGSSDRDADLFEGVNPSADTVWTTIFKPNKGAFAPGHLARITVTANISGITRVKHFWKSINFKFTSVPTLNSVASSAGSISGNGERSAGSMYILPTTGNMTLDWGHPKDEDGADLAGLTYKIELRYYTSTGTELATTIVDVGTGTTDVLTEAQIDAQGSASYIQADITARYPYGDNAALKIYFRRSDWTTPTDI